MIWLIVEMSGWLLLTAACFAVAGWAFAGERAAPGEQSLRRERKKIVADIVRLSWGEGVDDALPRERESDSMRRLIEIRDGRIAELERNLAVARARADDAVLRVAELERPDRREPERPEPLEVEARPVEDESGSLQAWRLRYFEQRVRYLEGRQETAAALAPAAEPPAEAAILSQAAPHAEWRARDAEARAAWLESALREATVAAGAAERVEDGGEPFAADADVDMLLRWRMLYLERRAAHFRAVAPATDAEKPDPEVWKWRARYLEARVRHLTSEQSAHPAAAKAEPVDVAVPEPAPPPAMRPPPRVQSGVRPPALASPRGGLPDDLTLIEGLSLMQQSTLNALGVFHFDQIAAWSADQIAWVDRYLYLRGRIQEDEWVEQARDLARDGVLASRRALESEEA
jgi:predicted flap endonuclease-1-like 5' DNA nuclease